MVMMVTTFIFIVTSNPVKVDTSIDQDAQNKKKIDVTYISDGIWIGNSYAGKYPKLVSKRISRVLTVQDKKTNYTTCWLNIKDKRSSLIFTYFNTTTIQIQQWLLSGYDILIHCHSGHSRSVTITMAYFMRFKGMSYNESYNHIRSQRKIANPNFGFDQQLKVYETILNHSENQYIEPEMYSLLWPDSSGNYTCL